MTNDSVDENYGKPEYNRMKLNFIDDLYPFFVGRPPPNALDRDKVHFAPFVNKYLSEVLENVRLNLTHMYKSYDYHKIFFYFSTSAFCEAIKVEHILHAASLQKM